MNKNLLLFLIIFSQFACTSVWFAINAVLPELTTLYALPLKSSLVFFTSVIQFGFIIGTLLFAFFNIADRFMASKIFFVCAIISSFSNICLLFPILNYWSIASLRFITGICLAGIYPIGIKIAADYYEKGLGKALGFLVGTLVLGTAIPHFFSFVALENNLQFVILLTSSLSIIGGLLVGFGVPKGPYSKSGGVFKPQVIFQLFKNKSFTQASIGYFGHMWELYTFWAIVPLLLQTYNNVYGYDFNISLWSFVIIVSGFFSCIVGGFISEIKSSIYVATRSLAGSLICILIFPTLIYFSCHPVLFMSFMIIWGTLVIADSPQFSTLVAISAPSDYKGSAITIVNCIGFFITIISIQIITKYSSNFSSYTPFLILAIGPVIGLLNLKKTNS